MRTLYEILDVSPNATLEEIKQGYRTKSKEFHPDKNPGDAIKAAEMKKITEAYSVLKDESRRLFYDAHGLIKQINVDEAIRVYLRGIFIQVLQMLNLQFDGVDFINTLRGMAQQKVAVTEKQIEENERIAKALYPQIDRFRSKGGGNFFGSIIQEEVDKCNKATMSLKESLLITKSALTFLEDQEYDIERLQYLLMDSAYVNIGTTSSSTFI